MFVMGMLDRYKKKGGFVQLLNLIETSGKQKQDQFLGLIAQESPVWEKALKQKMLSLERLLTWAPASLGEITARVQPLTLAVVVAGLPEEKSAHLLSSLSVSEKRKIQQIIDEKKPTPPEVAACVVKFLNEARAVMSGGIIKVEKIDPELAIPDNFEDHLNSQTIIASVSAPPSDEEPTGEGLVFSLDGRGATPPSAGSREEIDFLKRKVNTLSSENQTLKQEISQLRNKLDQIRRIA